MNSVHLASKLILFQPKESNRHPYKAVPTLAHSIAKAVTIPRKPYLSYGLAIRTYGFQWFRNASTSSGSMERADSNSPFICE